MEVPQGCIWVDVLLWHSTFMHMQFNVLIYKLILSPFCFANQPTYKVTMRGRYIPNIFYHWSTLVNTFMLMI